MDIVRKLLSELNLNPPGVRYDLDTDTVQTLIDGTWVNTPELDPRTAISGLYPPLGTGDTARCNAAAGMVAKIKSIVDYRIAVADQTLLVSGIVAILMLFFAPLGLLVELVWALAELMLAISAIDMADAFTSTFYDDLTCYFFCELDNSGRLRDGALDRIFAKVNDNYPGDAYDVFTNIVAVLGYIGLDNAGATSEETGDCGDCTDCDDCPNTTSLAGDYNFESSHVAGPWNLNPDGSPGTWTGSNWATSAWPSTPSAAITALAVKGKITNISIYVRACQLTGINVAFVADGTSTSSGTQNQSANGCAVSGAHTFTPSVPVCADRVDITITTASVGNGAISRIIIT